jgi:serine/threonine protein kinase/tetratricopeptide (TPR) repeat protein
MGEVYRANDARLDRQVAIKVLPPSLVSDAQTVARFIREARAVASLSHGNILSIFDFGTENGVTFAVMELLEGESLRARLRRGPYDWREAAELAAGVADGLAAAHAKGIVHRDLKPENLFITDDGRIKILDFGLAHTTDSQKSTSGTVRLDSLAGMIVGTIGYMAPEQLRAETAEPASDLFSLGCVLHEMLAGQHPFIRSSMIETSMAVLRDPAPRLSTRSVPADLGTIVNTCLEKNPAARFKSASEVRQALRGLLSGVRFKKAAPRRLRPLSDVAILPFANHSSDGSLDYLGDGIAEAVINTLASIPRIRVIPRATAFRYRESDESPAEVAAELDVRSVVTGHVVLRNETLVVGCELIDTTSNRQLWGQTFNRRFSDIFEVQDEMAMQISENLRVALTGEQKKKLKKRFTQDARAYQSYMKGRYFWNKRTEEGFKKAIEHFDLAIAQDPLYALAYAGLADTYALLGAAAFELLAPRETMPRAKSAAQRALEIDGTLVEAQTALAFVRRFYDWDWPEAEQDFRRACAINSSYPTARQWLALHLCEAGRFEEAGQQMAIAHELDPLSLAISADTGWVSYFARDYDTAIQRYRATLELDPDFAWGRFLLGLALVETGRYFEAIAEFDAALRATGRSSKIMAALGHAAALAGDHAEARQVLATLESVAHERYVSSYGIAAIHAGLGEVDRAFAALDKACEERAGYLVYLAVDPVLDPLRRDPRFPELLRKTKRPV